MRFIRRIVGFLLIVSGSAGLLGYPGDIPTWARCIRGLKPCPESLMNLPVIDGAKAWNIGTLAVGLLLLTGPPWLRRRPRLEPTTEFYEGVLERLVYLQHRGLVLNQDMRSFPIARMKGDLSVNEWVSLVSQVLVRYLPGSNRHFAEPIPGTAGERMNGYLARLSGILEDVQAEIERPTIEAHRRLEEMLRREGYPKSGPSS